MNWFLFVMILILITMGLYKAYKNTKQVAINKLTIDEQPTDQPSVQLNVLQISDLHLENISITAEQLYEKIKHEPIDLIALTGDFLDRKKSIPKLVPYLRVFNRLKPMYGTFAIYGNHDYVLRGENFDKLDQTLKNHGIRTMQNENVQLDIDGMNVNIIGIDDYSTSRSEFAQSYKGISDGYKLVLTHDPNAVLDMKNYHFDYLLSGHFHGGQILYPKAYHLVKMGKLPRMNMVKGLQTYDGKSFYISEGLGQTGVNIRVGSRPEITFHKLNIPAITKTKQQVS
ncbi:metallophosphoesterase [Salinibacillus xinjiangensis]|uniref:Metallophosphoesterase n=1 Tax=Salinibacillus xinjiangensis TaxID=1229268 RepID=A0A6G1X844_9BACI|nr:metallophosphoesterase [Salinibacillus xinjiangensis]MRG87112.1 metallophosphoesterase [Salinibacillus xinjiangensis]